MTIAGRTHRLYELLLALNIPASIVFAFLLRLTLNFSSVSFSDDFYYYFFRAAVRISDLLGIGSYTAILSPRPTLGQHVGIELAFWLPTITVTLALLIVYRWLRPRIGWLAIWMEGIAIIFFLPSLAIVVLRSFERFSAREFHGPKIAGLILLVELVCFVALAALHTRKPLSEWSWAILLSIHFLVWTVIEFSPYIARLTLYPDYSDTLFWSPLLIPAIPITATVLWIRSLNTTSTQMAPTRGLVIASIVFTLVSATLWFWAPSVKVRAENDGYGEHFTLLLRSVRCEEVCSHYTVRLSSSGSIRFEGDENSYVRQATGQIKREQLAEVLRLVEASSFYTLEERALLMGPHDATATISVDAEAFRRTVVFRGCFQKDLGLCGSSSAAIRQMEIILNPDQWLRDPNGHIRYRNSLAPRGDSEVSYSRDGSKIVFSSDRTGNFELYVWRLGAERPLQLTDTPDSDELMPSWSPDGNLLTFSSFKNGKESVMVMDSRSKTMRRLTSGSGYESSPVFSPDGKRIAFSEGSVTEGTNIKVVDLHVGSNTKITDSSSTNLAPSWAPDGKRVAYHSNRENNNFQLFEKDLVTGKERQLTTGNESSFFPVYSPDGDTLLHLTGSSGASEIRYIHHNLRDSVTPHGLWGRPTWHPSGNWFLTTSNSSGRSEIVRVAWDGSKKITPFNPETDLTPPAKK